MEATKVLFQYYRHFAVEETEKVKNLSTGRKLQSQDLNTVSWMQGLNSSH